MSGAIPDFTIAGVMWRCHVVRHGEEPGACAYEWRSACGRLAAGRDGATWWARIDGRPVLSGIGTLFIAMTAAMNAARRERAA